MRIYLGVVLFFVIASILFVAACTSRPTESEIPSIPTGRTGEFASKTATPSALSTPGNMEAYQLRSWSAEDCLEVLDLLEKAAINAVSPHLSSCIPLGNCREQLRIFLGYQNPIRLVLNEAFYRFPDLEQNEELQWKLAFAEAVVGETTNLDDRILGLLVDRVQSGYYDPNNMDGFLAGTDFMIHKPGAQIESISAENLFGDGRTSQIFVVSTSNEMLGAGEDGIVVAIRSDGDGSYRPVKLLSRWNLSGHFYDISIQDLTGDGKPEVVLEYVAASGSMHDVMIDIVQWQNSSFVRVTPNRSSISSSYQLTWDIGPLDHQGLPTFLTYEQTVAPSYAITRTYSWNGVVYELNDIQAEARESFGGMEIEIAGFYLDVEAQIELIETYLSNRPTYEVDSMGPSYSDFLRFRLAMLNFLQDHSEEALAILEELRDEPNNPEIQVVSAAAQAYLEAYNKGEDTYQGCKDAVSVMNAALGDEPTAWPYEQWGYVPYVQAPICSAQEAVVPILRSCINDGFNRTTRVVNCLQSVELTSRDYQIIDLDGDGDQDLLAMIPWCSTFWGKQELGFWIILTTKEGIVASKISTIPLQEESEITEFTLDSIPLASSAGRVHILHADHVLDVFQIQEPGRNVPVRVLLNSNSVDSYTVVDASESEQLLITEIQPGDAVWAVMLADHQFKYLDPGTNEVIYRWDIGAESLELITMQIDDKIVLPSYYGIRRAESFLFFHNQYLDAIPLLLAVIEDADANYFHPEALYLLGRAYERMDEQQKAVDAYWRLWIGYPDSPYALLAQSKLMLRE